MKNRSQSSVILSQFGVCMDCAGLFARLGRWVTESVRVYGILIFTLGLIHERQIGAKDDLTRIVMPQAIAWIDRDLKGGLQYLSTQTKVPIWLDRRVDPSTLVTIQCTGELWQVVAQIADTAKLRAVVVAPVIVVAHPDDADQIASSIEVSRDEARKYSTSRSLLASQTLAWDDVTSPQEIAAIIPRQWKTEVAVAELPHDLWRAFQFPEIDAVAALALLGSGFHLQPDFSESTVGWKRIPDHLQFLRKYAEGKLGAEVKAKVLSADPQAIWTPDSRGNVELTTTASAHQWVALFMAKRQAKTALPAGGNRYSLEVKATPAKKVILGIAQAEHWQVDWQASANERGAQAVTFEFKDTPAESLIDQVCKQVQLRWTRVDNRLSISSSP
jgi:hypothetical protein